MLEIIQGKQSFQIRVEKVNRMKTNLETKNGNLGSTQLQQNSEVAKQCMFDASAKLKYTELMAWEVN